jgi:hypothetical protein
VGAVVRAYPNTTVKIYRGVAVDVYGDSVDQATPLAEGVLASLIETEQEVQDASTETPRVVRSAVARLNQGTDVRITDRLLDERDGRLWSITDVTQVRNGAYDEDVRVDLEFVA